MRRSELDGGLENVGWIAGKRRILVVGLASTDVAEIKIEYTDDRYPQQMFETEEEGLRVFSAVVPFGGDVVAYDADGRVAERLPLEPRRKE